jgi:cell division septation protein DedD
VPTIKFKSSENNSAANEAEKNTTYTHFKVLPEARIEVPAEPVPEAIPEEVPEAAKPVIIKKYQIVVGAFSVESNAEKYVSVLRGKNYDASIVGKSKSGLTRVSINGSDSKSEAINMMNDIRNKENPAAWLLRIR